MVVSSSAKKERESWATIEPILPRDTQIQGVVVLERKIFYDPRGALIETFSSNLETDSSVYAYWSWTYPGEARDKGRYHFHQRQKDRLTVVAGRMWVLLLDMREDSPTHLRLEVIEIKGADLTVRDKTQVPVYTLTIPEMVYHAIMAPGPEGAMLVNHPTRPYDPSDEGRVAFNEVRTPNFGKFSWDLVRRS